MQFGESSSGRKAVLNQLIQTKGKLCQCIQEKKYTAAFNSPAQIISNKQRISRRIVTSLGGKIHFGNYYLGKPNIFNYLGRQEGQSGGGGIPIRNKF
jgi:hypothetical protein